MLWQWLILDLKIDKIKCNFTDVDLDQCSQRSTPYGIQFKAPLSNECVEKPMIFYIHLKDNTKVFTDLLT